MVNTNLTLDSFVHFLPAVFLYAELHFRFKWCGSRYYKKEPEILADIPIRIEPKKDIPILLIIKDAHLFPVILDEVNVEIYQSSYKKEGNIICLLIVLILLFLNRYHQYKIHPNDP